MGQSVGFIGVGRMGGPMARRLIETGFKLTIYNTSEAAMPPLIEKGAPRADLAAAVASAAEIVIVSLPTPLIVQTVALGPKGVIEGSNVKIFIDASTTGSAYAKKSPKSSHRRGSLQWTRRSAAASPARKSELWQ